MYLLQLIQQISTFAVNYQGRPFRESLSENKGMFYGIIGVTAIAFSCSTEFVPEINERMSLVKFTDEFKLVMTSVMVLDYGGCWAVERVLKMLFSDFRPRDIALRRPEQDEREQARKAEEQKVKDELEERRQAEKVAEFERKVEERKRKIEAWAEGRKPGAVTAGVGAGSQN